MFRYREISIATIVKKVDSLFFFSENIQESQVCWCTLVIPATWEVEARRSRV
jgi:hypothetical protein